jgi:hypothetical protein
MQSSTSLIREGIQKQVPAGRLVAWGLSHAYWKLQSLRASQTTLRWFPSGADSKLRRPKPGELKQAGLQLTRNNVR